MLKTEERANRGDWSAGKYIGEGLDKKCYEAMYKGVMQPNLVLKTEALYFSSYNQMEQEVAHQDMLLAMAADHAWARAVLNRLAYIVCYGVIGDDVRGVMWCIQERVTPSQQVQMRDINRHSELWSKAGRDGFFSLSDMHYANWGCRQWQGEDTPVILDWGIVPESKLEDLGKHLVTEVGEEW